MYTVYSSNDHLLHVMEQWAVYNTCSCFKFSSKYDIFIIKLIYLLFFSWEKGVKNFQFSINKVFLFYTKILSCFLLKIHIALYSNSNKLFVIHWNFHLFSHEKKANKFLKISYFFQNWFGAVWHLRVTHTSTANVHLLMILVFSMKNIVLQIYLMCWTIFPGTKTKHFLSVYCHSTEIIGLCVMKCPSKHNFNSLISLKSWKYKVAFFISCNNKKHTLIKILS